MCLPCVPWKVATCHYVGGCLAVMIVAALTLAGDAPDREGKARAGELIVRAADMSHRGQDGRFMGIVAIDPQTAKWRTLYKGPESGPLSPDGRYMAFMRRGPGVAEADVGVWVYNLADKVLVNQVFDRRGYPLWSHDGRKIFIVASVREQLIDGKHTGKFETWQVNADGTGLTKLPISEDDFVLDCSRDGTWLATRTLGEGSDHWGRLTLVHPDGTGSRDLTGGAIKDHVFSIFRISPDGRRVAYVEIRVEDNVRKSRLFVVDIEGGNRREIPVAFEPNTTATPSWSPDSTRLALGLVNDETNEGAIWLVDLDGTNFQKLALPPGRWNLKLYDWR
jgi:Tol biopolymer transport system component